MKIKLTSLSLLFILLLSMDSYGQPMEKKHWRKEARCCRASELNLSYEQLKSLDQLQQAFLKETQLLRAQLITKRLEFRDHLTNPTMKMDSIRMKHNELIETQTKLEEKAMEYLVRVRNLLSTEQLKFWCPEHEFPFFQRIMPGYGPMGPRSPQKALPPGE